VTYVDSLSPLVFHINFVLLILVPRKGYYGIQQTYFALALHARIHVRDRWCRAVSSEEAHLGNLFLARTEHYKRPRLVCSTFADQYIRD
jgi:hypothetical protein